MCVCVCACVCACVHVCVCAFVGTFSSFSSLCSTAPGLPKHVEGIIVGASVLAAILVVAFILLIVAAGYYYYRENKVVIVKVFRAWAMGYLHCIFHSMILHSTPYRLIHTL